MKVAVGDKVTLTDILMNAVAHPEKYQVGEVTEIGTHSVVSVKWNGINRPIDMREDELKKI